MSKSLFSYF